MAATLAELVRRLNAAHGSARVPRLWLLSDPVRLPDPEPLLDFLPPASAVVLRDYGVNSAGRVARARVLAVAVRSHRSRLIVAGDAHVAMASGADGLHLPEALARRPLRPATRLWLSRKDRVLTAAAHGFAGLRRARALGAAALLSPVYPTQSHPGRRPLGPCRFLLLARRARMPVIALGGIDGAGAARLVPRRGNGATRFRGRRSCPVPAGFATVGGVLR